MNVFDWIINLPNNVLPIFESIIDILFTPILTVFSNFIGTSSPIGEILFNTLEKIFESLIPNFGEQTSLISLLLGIGLPAVIVISLAKWIIGIIT